MYVLLIDGNYMITTQYFPDELAVLTVTIVASGQGTEGTLHHSKTDFLLLYKSYRGRKSVNST